MVSFTDTGILVGEDAQNNAIHNPENTISDIMRFIGRDWNDKEFQRDLKIVPYKVF